MNKKAYHTPSVGIQPIMIRTALYQVPGSIHSTGDENIGDGGIGSNDDDPEAKFREEAYEDETIWGNLW